VGLFVENGERNYSALLLYDEAKDYILRRRDFVAAISVKFEGRMDGRTNRLLETSLAEKDA
jgi:hypothetical protein